MMLIITPNGRACSLYAETIDLHRLGEMNIARASHVEPDDQGNWWADLAPVAGPKLGPFTLRSQALAAEQDWLNDHLASLAAAPRPIPHITTPS